MPLPTDAQPAAAEPKQYNVVLSYGTYADSPEEAVSIALTAIEARTSVYVEVFPESGENTVIEGEIAEIVPHSDT